MQFNCQRPLIALAAAVLMLSGCAWQPTLDDPAVAERVRAPAAEEGDGLQVYPLRNPAVQELETAAAAAQADGNFDRAEAFLDRALRIEPRDPELLQQMAELQLVRGRWEQAEHYARRSWELGPQVGDICRRNWETVALALEYSGQQLDASRARERKLICPVKPPERF